MRWDNGRSSGQNECTTSFITLKDHYKHVLRWRSFRFQPVSKVDAHLSTNIHVGSTVKRHCSSSTCKRHGNPQLLHVVNESLTCMGIIKQAQPPNVHTHTHTHTSIYMCSAYLSMSLQLYCNLNAKIFVVTIFRGLNFCGDKFSWVRIDHCNYCR